MDQVKPFLSYKQQIELLAQYLLHELQLLGTETLPSVLKKFPHNDLVPFSRLGAPGNWQESPLWVTKTS